MRSRSARAFSASSDGRRSTATSRSRRVNPSRRSKITERSLDSGDAEMFAATRWRFGMFGVTLRGRHFELKSRPNGWRVRFPHLDSRRARIGREDETKWTKYRKKMTPIGVVNSRLKDGFMRTYPFRNPEIETWEEESQTVIYGDDLLEDLSASEALQAILRRSSRPPPPLPSLRPSSLKPSTLPARPRHEMPTPVMLVEPGLHAFRPESRPPAPEGDDALHDVHIPPSSPVPRGFDSMVPPQPVPSIPPPPGMRRGDSGFDTLRPYVGSTRPRDRSQHPPSVASGSTPSALSGRVVPWTLALASIVLALVAFNRPPEQRDVEAPPIFAGPPLLLDGDSIEPFKEPEPSFLQRVKSGQGKALATLQGREPTSLSTDEVEALAHGLEVRAREKTIKTVSALAKKWTLTAEDKAEFLTHAGNQRTYRQALTAMAQNNSWQGPDLIHAALESNRSQKDIADFALALLLTDHSYKYASPALTVIIDAETLTQCEDIRQLIDRAREDGDRRAVRHLAKFTKTTGCGPNETDDCYPCLRQDRALTDALRACRGRMPPL